MLIAGCQTNSTSASAETSRPVGPIKVEPQRDWSDAVLYFVIVDRFADGDVGNNDKVDKSKPGGWHGGDLKGLAQQLDEIADLGATAIWITPVVRQIDFCPFAAGPPETGTDKGFDHCGFHGYWADDFETLDPHFGTEEDLKAFVDAAHARGIKVLLDVVYNHPGYGSRYEEDPGTKSWIRVKQVDCAADPILCQVGGLPDFKTELPEVQDYLISTTLGLADRTGLDGFRLDTVKHVDHDFWERHRQATREQLGDDFFLLAEVWGGSAQVLDEWFSVDQMDAGFDFTFKGSCQAFVQGRGRTIAFAGYLEKRHKVRDGYHLAHYLSSHDEPVSLHELGGDKKAFKLCVALQMSSLGIPVIYYGEEVAREGSVWPLNRNDMPWGKSDVSPGKNLKRDESMRAYYKQLIQIRREHPALSRGDYQKLFTDGDLLVFSRIDEESGDAVIVAVNRGQQSLEASVDAPQGWTGAAKEAISGDSVVIEGNVLPVNVPGRAAHIYVVG